MRTLNRFLLFLLFATLSGVIALLVAKVVQPRDVVISAGTTCVFQKWRDDLPIWQRKNALYADYDCGGTVVLMYDTSVLSDQLHHRGSRVKCAMDDGRWVSDPYLACTLVPRVVPNDLG